MKKNKTLRVSWREPLGEPNEPRDFVFSYPQKCDGTFLHYAFFATPMHPDSNRTFADELKARGYDITTLKFSIKRQ